MNGVTLTFTYDQHGRMTKVVRRQRIIVKVSGISLGSGPATGGDQKRRSRAVSGGDTTKYRYGSGWEWHRHVEELNEESGAGTLEATYIHHPGKQIGTVLATSAGTTASTGTWAYYFQDAIGSTRGLWDEEGDRIGKYDYTPFGGKYSDHGEDITRKFTGHDWDSAARLYYTAYRYYSPDANRWLTRDPLGMVDGPNVYAYVMNNPVSIWDALGQCGANANTAPGGGGDGDLVPWWEDPQTLVLVSWVFCILGLARSLLGMSGLLGGHRTSVGVAIASGAFAAAMIGVVLLTEISESRVWPSSVTRQLTEMGIVGAGAGALAGVLHAVTLTDSIALARIAIEVLDGALGGMVTGFSCAVAGTNYLISKGVLNVR